MPRMQRISLMLENLMFKYPHLRCRCVLDADMSLGNKSLPFHSLGFNMIGFGKVK